MIYKRFACLVLAAAVPWGALCAQEHDEELEEWKPGEPGLIATWSDGDRTVVQLESRPVFRWDVGDAPHPQIMPDRFDVLWRGILNVERPGVHRFSAEVIGEFSLAIDGVDLLTLGGQADGKMAAAASPPVELEYGTVPIEMTFRKSAAGPAMLRVFWQREDELSRPLSANVLYHEKEERPTELEKWQSIERGRRLVHEHHCAACHTRGNDSNQSTDAKTFRGPRLDELASRVNNEWIYRWLQNPHAMRPNTAMPKLFGDSDDDLIDIFAATEFLGSLGTPLEASAESSAATLSESPLANNEGMRAFAATGCIACHAALDEEAPGFPQLHRLEGLAAKTTAENVRQRIVDPARHFADSRMPAFDLSDDTETLDAIVSYLVKPAAGDSTPLPQPPSRQAVMSRYESMVDDEPRRAEFAELDAVAQRMRLGQEVVNRRGCMNCHSLEQLQERVVEAAPLTALILDSENSDEASCLSKKPQIPAADFRFTADERRSIAQFLKHGVKGPVSAAPQAVAERDLQQMGCTACHARNGRQSEFAQRILSFVTLESDQQLRDLLPPDLSAVGEKLQPGWIHAVVVDGKRARPWMDLRMPQFRQERIAALPARLVAADGLDPKFREPQQISATDEQLEVGRLLVGRTGFNCISCHDIRGIESTGVRGPDLAGVVRRVRHGWFERWLLDPQQISPGTRMPSVFFGGRSAAPQYFGGDPESQLAALWAYLAQGESLKVPPMDLVLTAPIGEGENPRFRPQNRPQLVRGFMGEYGGNRGIALGYPQGTHFGFDSETCRLAAAWQGDFIEAGGWFGKGRGGAEKDFNRVLGEVFWQASAGESLEIVPRKASRSSIPQDGNALARFDGCWTLADDAGFAYRVPISPDKWIRVEDRPAPLENSELVGFQRSLKINDTIADHRLQVILRSDVADGATIEWLGPEGTIREAMPGDEGAAIEVDAAGFAWCRLKDKTGEWLLSLRQYPEHTKWRAGNRKLQVHVPLRTSDEAVTVSFFQIRGTGTTEFALPHLEKLIAVDPGSDPASTEKRNEAADTSSD